MAECQICLINEGKEGIQVEGLCGVHAKKTKDVLDWFCTNKEALEKLDLNTLAKKFEK